ncbi:MAG: mechanosensitive ion channel [Treponema sp.]|nr:mechanosensitive ion channel [Treponema sp.]
MDLDIAQLWAKYSQIILDIGRKLIIAVLIIVGGRIIISLSKNLAQKAVTGKLKADETLASVLRMVVHYGIIIICLIMILDLFGVNTAGLIALLGGAVVAVGFALKDTLGNIASGIIILLLRPFKKGDFIECGPVMGSVREMGLFATTMETADGVYISAPNSSLWGVPLKNYSRNEKRRIDIAVSISYSNSIDEAFRVLNDIISEEDRFLKDPPAQVMVQSLGDSGIGVTLRAWVPGATYWKVYWDQMKNVKEKIQAAGLSIAFPKRDIRLVKDDRVISTEKSRDANKVGEISGG